MAKGGARAGAGRPKKVTVEILLPGPGDAWNPEVMRDYASPAEFLMDVVNMKMEKLGVQKLSLDHRMKAAAEALPYIDKKQPVAVEAKHDHSWSDRVRAADSRRAAAERAAEATTAEAMGEAADDHAGG